MVRNRHTRFLFRPTLFGITETIKPSRCEFVALRPSTLLNRYNANGEQHVGSWLERVGLALPTKLPHDNKISMGHSLPKCLHIAEEI